MTTNNSPNHGLPAPLDDDPLILTALRIRQLRDVLDGMGFVLQTAAGPLTIHVQTFASGNTDGTGFRTFNHGAGWAPRGVWLINTGPGASWATYFGFDSATATQFRARFMHAGVGGSYNSAATGALFGVLIK